MNCAVTDLPPMPLVLQRAGFRVAGNRADCAKCTGCSRRTVSFTSEVACCHRCGWSANQITLARELGLPKDPRTSQFLRQERERHQRLEVPIRAFEAWRDKALSRAIDEHRILSRRAFRAETALKNYADCEAAWDALATFYHRQAALSADLDQLGCAKVSDFLAAPYTIERLFLEWRATAYAA